MSGKRGLLIGVFLVLIFLGAGVYAYSIQDIYASVTYPTNNNFYTADLSYFNWSLIVNDYGLTSCYYDLNSIITYFNCNLRSVPFSSNLQEGYYNLTLDVVNNNSEESSSKRSFGVDSLAPRVNFVSPPTPSNNSAINTNTFNIRLSVSELNEANISLKVNRDSSNYALDVSNSSKRDWTYGSLVEGHYDYSVTVYDKYGHSTTVSRSLLVDYTNPSNLINSPVSGIYDHTINSLSFVAGDNYYVDYCSYSDNAGANYTNFGCVNGTNTLSLISKEGNNNWSVKVYDTAGNVNSSRVDFWVDSIYPLIDFAAPTLVDSSYASQNFIVANVSVVEANPVNVTFRLYNSVGTKINETTYSSVGSSNIVLWAGLGNGVYDYNVTVADIVNHVNKTEKRRVTLDTIAPSVVINNPKAINYTSDSLLINFSATDTNLASCWYSDDGGVSNHSLPGCSNAVYTASQGTTVLVVYANDLAGNVNSATVSFYVDSIAPSVIYESDTTADETNTTLRDIIVNVSASDSGSGIVSVTIYLYNLSGQINFRTITASSNYMDFSSLDDGVYYFNATAVDWLGNLGASATRTVRIDNLAPILSFGSSSTGDSVTINIGADDVSGLNGTCSVDRPGALLNGLVLTETGLSCGTSYTYNVSCWDNTGHLGNSLYVASTSSCSSGGSGGGGGGGSGGGSVRLNSSSVQNSQVVSQGTGGTHVEPSNLNQGSTGEGQDSIGNPAPITGSAIGGGIGRYVFAGIILVALVGAYVAVAMVRRKRFEDRVRFWGRTY